MNIWKKYHFKGSNKNQRERSAFEYRLLKIDLNSNDPVQVQSRAIKDKSLFPNVFYHSLKHDIHDLYSLKTGIVYSLKILDFLA